MATGSWDAVGGKELGEEGVGGRHDQNTLLWMYEIFNKLTKIAH